MSNSNSKPIGKILGILLVVAFIVVVVVGCVLQSKNEWKHRNELSSAKGEGLVIGAIGEIDNEYNKTLIKGIDAKVVENTDDYKETVIYYAASVYYYNVDLTDGIDGMLYYSYKIDAAKAEVITVDAYNAATATVTFTYQVDESIVQANA